MDEVAKTKLVALAIVQVKSRLVAMMDFDSAKAEGRAQMEVAAQSLGLSAREGRKSYDEGSSEFQQDLEAFAERQAGGEVSKAIEEAEEEQERHTALLADLRQIHAELMQKLAGYSGSKSWAQLAESGHRDFMAIIQEKHCLNLWHCFAKHLVPEGTVLVQLIDLYEIK